MSRTGPCAGCGKDIPYEDELCLACEAQRTIDDDERMGEPDAVPGFKPMEIIQAALTAALKEVEQNGNTSECNVDGHIGTGRLGQKDHAQNH